tara:strand:+ start:355 stop:504 length:150 start_codon:yes stop_codon:yes gene_type:complete
VARLVIELRRKLDELLAQIIEDPDAEATAKGGAAVLEGVVRLISSKPLL